MSCLLDDNVLCWIDVYVSDGYGNLNSTYMMQQLKLSHAVIACSIRGTWPKWWSSVIIKN